MNTNCDISTDVLSLKDKVQVIGINFFQIKFKIFINWKTRDIFRQESKGKMKYRI